MTTRNPGPMGYCVNLDERGSFYADVRDASGTTLFEIRSEDDGSIAPVEDGYMKHKNDLAGLKDYLVELGILDKGAELLSFAEFEDRLEASAPGI